MHGFPCDVGCLSGSVTLTGSPLQGGVSLIGQALKGSVILVCSVNFEDATHEEFMAMDADFFLVDGNSLLVLKKNYGLQE